MSYRAQLTESSTPQEVYNHLKAAFAAGSFPSTNPQRCLYRDGERACHIGIFIPDNLYQPEFETNYLKPVLQELAPRRLFPAWFTESKQGALSFAEALQNTHDTLVWDSQRDAEQSKPCADWVKIFRQNWPAAVKKCFSDAGYAVTDDTPANSVKE